MAQAKPINLIQANVQLSPQMEGIGDFLHRIGIWALGALIISGVVVTSIFFYLQNSETRLGDMKSQLTASIAQQTAKEGILFTLKQRAVLVDKMFGVQKPVNQI